MLPEKCTECASHWVDPPGLGVPTFRRASIAAGDGLPRGTSELGGRGWLGQGSGRVCGRGVPVLRPGGYRWPLRDRLSGVEFGCPLGENAAWSSSLVRGEGQDLTGVTVVMGHRAVRSNRQLGVGRVLAVPKRSPWMSASLSPAKAPHSDGMVQDAGESGVVHVSRGRSPSTTTSPCPRASSQSVPWIAAIRRSDLL